MQKLLQIRKFKIQVVLSSFTNVPPPHFRDTGSKFESFDVRIELSEHDLSKNDPLPAINLNIFEISYKGAEFPKKKLT